MEHINELENLFVKLLNHFGPQDWWPGDTEFEIMVGAILTQNVNWDNVEKAIENLKDEELLEPDRIEEVDRETLEEHIEPTGFYRKKAERVKRLTDYIKRSGGIKELEKGDDIRSSLLELNGIGNETADSMMLYALDKQEFVIDAYTKRILNRVFDVSGDYNELKDRFESELLEDVDLYKEYHALLVELGKNNCRPNPRCDDCPVTELCKSD